MFSLRKFEVRDLCKKSTFHKANVLLSNSAIYATKVVLLLDANCEFRHLPHGDKTIFFPHSVDNRMPDQRTFSHGHNRSIPKLLTSNPQVKRHLSPVSPQPCPQQNSILAQLRCVNALLARRFHELKLSR